jgi:hypothetical protein
LSSAPPQVVSATAAVVTAAHRRSALASRMCGRGPGEAKQREASPLGCGGAMRGDVSSSCAAVLRALSTLGTLPASGQAACDYYGLTGAVTGPPRAARIAQGCSRAPPTCVRVVRAPARPINDNSPSLHAVAPAARPAVLSVVLYVLLREISKVDFVEIFHLCTKIQ